jgi:hypothetical protein
VVDVVMLVTVLMVEVVVPVTVQVASVPVGVVSVESEPLVALLVPTIPEPVA